MYTHQIPPSKRRMNLPVGLVQRTNRSVLLTAKQMALMNHWPSLSTYTTTVLWISFVLFGKKYNNMKCMVAGSRCAPILLL